MSARRLPFVILGAASLATPTFAQVPDLLNALDSGGRAMGMGGSLNPTSSDTLASYNNPAGLAYINESTIGAAVRNLPRSRTVASGELNDPTLTSRGQAGQRELTHFGFAFPFGKGALGMSYTVGGFIDDFRTGNITVGGSPVTGYAERVHARSDYFSISYGHASGDQAFAWGIGLQFVQQAISDDRQGNITAGGTIDANPRGTTAGVAGIIGVQFNPRNSNISYGFSYRTEVNLSENSQTSPLMDKIPARLMGGVAIRQDHFRNGRDFAIFGVDVTHYFSATNSDLFNRKAQTTGGIGVEYNYDLGGSRVPLRLGYSFIPGGGDGYGDRNALTFGFGYRPANGLYTIDLNFASPQHGGNDLGLSASFKLGHK